MKDHRLLVICGFTLEVPGAKNIDAAKSLHGVKIIGGASDEPCGAEPARLTGQSRAYAEKYNRTMISIMR